MALRQQISHIQSQQLVLSPQIRQFLKLLQLPSLELKEAIEQELAQNPAIEELPEEPASECSDTLPDDSHDVQSQPELNPLSDEDIDFRKKMDELDQLDELFRHTTQPSTRSGMEQIEDLEKKKAYRETLITKQTSLADHLLWQSRLLALSEDDQRILEYLIGNINEDGYLVLEIEDISSQTGAPPEKVRQILEILQNMEPPGVAARDLGECLAIQLKRMDRDTRLALRIVIECLPFLEKRKYLQIARTFKVNESAVREAVKIIARLEPKPGRRFYRDEPISVVPDIRVYKDDITDRYRAEMLEEGFPRLRISPHYRRMLRDKELDKKTREYLRERINSGLWFMNAIGQRKSTLENIANALVEIQQDFFEYGPSHLRPLRMKDIAARLGIHESTVSRAIQGKYMSTPHSTVSLRSLFTSSLSTDNGSEESQTSLIEKIRAMIESENPGKPLSDQHIALELGQQGIRVARRTVAKYREIIKILPSHLRKRELPSRTA